MTRRILLAGATGYIGSWVARELLQHGYSLLCPLRSLEYESLKELRSYAPSPEHFKPLVCQISDRASLEHALSGQHWDAAVSCIGSRSRGSLDSERIEYRANHNLLDLSLDVGAEHFTLLSAICVQKPRLAFQFAKLRFEDELRDSGLTHSIVRPTAFFKSLSGQLQRVKQGKPFLIFGDGELTRCKPIAESELAQYLRLTLEDRSLQGVLPLGGPGPALTPLMQAAILERLLETPVAVRKVPPQLLLWTSRALSLPAAVSNRVSDKAEFARIDHYYATESMLLWDAENHRYDAEATPEFGRVTLEDSYRAQLEGRKKQDLGDQAAF